MGTLEGGQWRLAVDTECQYGSREKGIRQILEKKLEYNKAVHQLFTDLEKACGRSPAEIVGSNPTGGMDICLL